MLRRLFTLLSAVSLALCVASWAGWASRPALQTAERVPIRAESHSLSSGPYGLAYVHLRTTRPNSKPGGDPALVGRWQSRRHTNPSIHIPVADAAYPQRLGFARGRELWDFNEAPDPDNPAAPPPPSQDLLIRTVTVVPHWAAAGLFVALPAVHQGLWLARRRRCRDCGYDRRGSPGRCPECGAEPTIPARGDA